MRLDTPIEIPFSINRKELVMELDTGAGVSLISKQMYHCLLDEDRLLMSTSTTQLRTYSGGQLGVLSTSEVRVSYNSHQVTLPLLVVKGVGPSLFRRDWLSKIRLNWRLVNSVNKPQSSLKKVLSQ